jgi:hypothetical protein
MRLAGKTNGTSSSGIAAGAHPTNNNTTEDNNKASVLLSHFMAYLFFAVFEMLHPKIKNST